MTNRQEVAEKLRESGKGNHNWSMTIEVAFSKIIDSFGKRYMPYNCKPYEFFFNTLADLIDPTCSIYFVDTSTDTPDGYEQDGYYCCSHCHNELIGSFGYAWDDYQANDYKGESPFDYCPHCGARVVRNEA